MRKLLVVVVASGALLALAPATALAQHHGRRHHHHARVHHKTFGSDPASGTSTPAQPTATVVSFTNGVLTIKANDGNTASGMVTADTEIECQGADMSELRSHDHGGGDNGGGDNGQGDDQGDDQGPGDDGANQMCTTANLVQGAMVQEARLSISSAGAVWDKVELIAQSSSPTSVTDTDNDGD
jgi:hypothetical protein